jgi:hypothetical protein
MHIVTRQITPAFTPEMQFTVEIGESSAQRKVTQARKMQAANQPPPPVAKPFKERGIPESALHE